MAGRPTLTRIGNPLKEILGVQRGWSDMAVHASVVVAVEKSARRGNNKYCGY